MPTYDYACQSEQCNHEWEEMHSITAEPVQECPKCKELTAKRLISGSGAFILSGGGWAADNYGSSK